MIFANAFAIGCLGGSLESPWLLPRPWPCGCVTSPALGESAASAGIIWDLLLKVASKFVGSLRNWQLILSSLAAICRYAAILRVLSTISLCICLNLWLFCFWISKYSAGALNALHRKEPLLGMPCYQRYLSLSIHSLCHFLSFCFKGSWLTTCSRPTPASEQPLAEFGSGSPPPAGDLGRQVLAKSLQNPSHNGLEHK